MSQAQTCPGPNPSCLNSNTILAAIPDWMSLKQAKSNFRKYGEIQGLDVVPGSNPRAVAVCYFDLRAAMVAFQALGGEKYCRFGPPTGERAVRLPGEFNLSPEDIGGVANLTVDEVDGCYTVEFFDVRAANRVRSASEDQEKDVLEPPPGLEHLAPPPGLEDVAALAPQPKDMPEPAYISSSAKAKAPSGMTMALVPENNGLKDVTNMPPRPSSNNSTIMVVGLPNMLCTDACFEATLQQAGFQGSVVHFSTKPGKPCGEAIIWLNNVEAAQLCLAHFQGRKWDNSGKEVKAWLIYDTSMTDPWARRKRCDTGISTVSTDVGAPSDGDEEQMGRVDSLQSQGA